MKRFAFLFTLLPSLLTAELTSSSISSERASYDGNSLMLKGNVHLQHMLGILESGTARLEKEDKDTPFSTIFLKDDVLITLKNRGKISCGEALFDFAQMKGTLKPKKGEPILFSRLDARDLMLSSQDASIEFSNGDNDSIEVTKIEANRNVHVKYQKDIHLDAEHALFQGGETPTITAYHHCTLTHNGDKIFAEKVELFPQTSTVVLTAPNGVFTGSSFSQEIDFSCNQMVWNQTAEQLTLKGDVSIQDASIGDILCEDELELHQKKEGDKWMIASLTAKGRTTLSCQLSDQKTHFLVCSGKMRLDHERLVLTLESSPSDPIEYFQGKVNLQANQAQFDYAETEHHLDPKKLVLTGHVLLTGEEEGARCALADQFTYYPEEEKMVLSSTEGKNVLFWDETQDLSISATEVHIVHAENGEKVKGVGNVRFAFSSTENALLQKLFPFYKPKNGGR